MPRVDRSRTSVRLRLSLSLERLEKRQLLSIAPIHVAVPQPLPPMTALQPGDYLPIPGVTVPVPGAIFVPAQIQRAYGLNQVTDQGQGETIALVDAYSQPNIRNDISVFSSDFGLPQMDGKNGDPTLSVLVPTGQPTPIDAPTSGPNAGWGIEISLDVEWAHSIAPYANIDLITCTNSGGDYLFGAEVDHQPYSSGVVYAATLPGVVVVSNSYGSGEFNGETNYDSQFTTNPNVAYTVSTGDGGAPGEYPAYSPNVVAVGGTSLTLLGLKGQYGLESGWSGSGGGVSQYESVPSFQSSNGVNNGARSIPDVSMDANPNTGVYVYDSYDGGPNGYYEVGGTSLSSPMWAGLIALGDQARGTAGALNSAGVLDALYGAYDSSNYSTDFHDVTTGSNGHSAGTGYDLVTGIGTPKAPAIVSLLGSTAPAVKIGGGGGVIGGPAAIGTGSAGFTNLDYDSSKSISARSARSLSVACSPVPYPTWSQRWISLNQKRSAACFPSSELFAVVRLGSPIRRASANTPSTTGPSVAMTSRTVVSRD